MDTLEIILLISMGVYFLLMMLTSVDFHRSQNNQEFMIANRNLGFIPIVSSLAASFRDGTGIVVWIGFGITIGYGGMWLMLGVLLAMCVYVGFGPRMRQSSINHSAITVGELIRTAVGPITEKLSAALVLIFSLVIIAIQLYVAGNLFAEIIGLEHWLGMSIVAIIVGSYLMIGGYAAVIKTDIIQVVLIFSVILVPLFFITDSHQLLDVTSVFAFPLVDRAALFLIGFFYVMSSADVWQKIFAAKNDAVIRTGFPLSGVLLIFMTLSLIWLGMSVKDLLVGEFESGRALFEIFDQAVLPTPMLALLAVVVMAITMSTLDTFCYLFSSSLSKNFLATGNTENLEHYIGKARITMLSVLAVGVILAILINDVLQTVFSAASLLFILAPLYICLGFGWIKNTQRLDRMVSLSILISVVVYIVMFVRGDFANMIMLTVPVFVNITLLFIMLLFSRITGRVGPS